MEWYQQPESALFRSNCVDPWIKKTVEKISIKKNYFTLLLSEIYYLKISRKKRIIF